MNQEENRGYMLYSSRENHNSKELSECKRRLINKYFCLWLLFLIIFVPFTNTIAFGCENPTKELSQGEIQHYRKLIESPNADPVEQSLAIEALMCDKRSAVRNVTIQTALNLENSFIRAKILEEILYQKQIIIIEFLPIENPNEKIKKWLGENPGISYEVKFVNRKDSCLSIYYNERCDPGYTIDISGTKVDIHYNADFATFKLDSNNELVGKFYPKNLGSSIPAKIIIY